MIYNEKEVLQFVAEEDVRFVRLAFCDALGNHKNIAILADELPRAFEEGISFDASAVVGFSNIEKSDLLLFPEPSTLSVLPWRPSNGRVVRLFCRVCNPDGSAFEMDTRKILCNAIAEAKMEGILCNFGAEFEFYLFEQDDEGNPTKIPYDHAGYLDVAPMDKGENIRREISLTLEEMGIHPETSLHEEGPGQNEIDFRYSDALSAADNAITFRNVVRTVAARNGLFADFSPKPLPHESGNGLHINMSLMTPQMRPASYDAFMAGILSHIREITVFLNPTTDSYHRLGEKKAPRYISWSPENRSPLIRIPAATGTHTRMELRSADCCANPYLAYALLIWAGLDGIRRKLQLPDPININLFSAPESLTASLETLPQSLEEARMIAAKSTLVQTHIPQKLLEVYQVK